VKFHPSPLSLGVRVGLVSAMAALSLGFAQFAMAQQTLGSINGTVADTSGALIQGARCDFAR
jgi:hypothetical protein